MFEIESALIDNDASLRTEVAKSSVDFSLSIMMNFFIERVSQDMPSHQQTCNHDDSC